MSTERAQKSEVHETTDDATTSPANRTDPDRIRSGNAGGGGRGDVVTRASDAGTLDMGNARERDAGRSAAETEGGRPVGSENAAEPFAAAGMIGGGPGASDGYSGGGPGSNNPDAETAIRAGTDRFDRGDVEADRRKLFPDAPASASNDSASDETRVRNDPDESSFGGPLRVSDPAASRDE